MSFDLHSVRLGTQIGSDLITAECLLPGCAWTMNFSWGAMRLATITETCAAHPCKSELINELHVIAKMTANEGMQLLRRTLKRYDQAAEMGA